MTFRALCCRAFAVPIMLLQPRVVSPPSRHHRRLFQSHQAQAQIQRICLHWLTLNKYRGTETLDWSTTDVAEVRLETESSVEWKRRPVLSLGCENSFDCHRFSPKIIQRNFSPRFSGLCCGIGTGTSSIWRSTVVVSLARSWASSNVSVDFVLRCTDFSILRHNGRSLYKPRFVSKMRCVATVFVNKNTF